MATVKGKAQDVADSAGELAGQAKEKVQEWATTAYEQTGSAMQTACSESTQLIRRYPWQALLAGFAAGFLLARVTRT